MAFHKTNLTFFAADLLSPSGVVFLVYFSVMLLLLGFGSAYMFRSPIAGLIGVVPCILCVSFLSELIRRLVLKRQVRQEAVLSSMSGSHFLILVLVALAVVSDAWVLQRLLASPVLDDEVIAIWTSFSSTSLAMPCS
ncbi:MAG: hypothetical protein ACR2N1_06185 [Rubripirellula sp.]